MPRPGLPKLIATDLDGTLVRSDDTVSSYTHEVLDRVRAAGIPIVGATGRGPRLTELCRHDIRDADFLVLAGGGRVRRPERPGRARSCSATQRLPGRVLAEVLAALEAEVGPLTVMVEALDEPRRAAVGRPRPDLALPGLVRRATAGRLPRPADVSRGSPAPRRTTSTSCSSIAREDRPARRSPRSPRPGSATSRSCRPDVDKATGLAVVAQSLGVDPGDVLVFGDMPNDLPMFAWAGWGRVAVANAHPLVRAAADEVTVEQRRRRRGRLPRPAALLMLDRHRPRRHAAAQRQDDQPVHGRRTVACGRCRHAGRPGHRPADPLAGARVRAAAHRRCRRCAPTARSSTTRWPIECCAPIRWNRRCWPRSPSGCATRCRTCSSRSRSPTGARCATSRTYPVEAGFEQAMVRAIETPEDAASRCRRSSCWSGPGKRDPDAFAALVGGAVAGLAEATHSSLHRAGRDLRGGRDQGGRAGLVLRPGRASTRRRWWRSATCPTTCRC